MIHRIEYKRKLREKRDDQNRLRKHREEARKKKEAQYGRRDVQNKRKRKRKPKKSVNRRMQNGKRKISHNIDGIKEAVYNKNQYKTPGTDDEQECMDGDECTFHNKLWMEYCEICECKKPSKPLIVGVKKYESEGMSLHQILKQQNFAKHEEEKHENVKVLSMDESMERQFYNFLKGMRMEKYFDKFKENECCDMDSIELFDDETLKDDIGIKNKIARRKFLKKCRKLKTDMDCFKDDYGIPSIVYERLAKYGIVTLNVLCEEVQKRNDLMIKYKMINENQCDLLWNIIQQNVNGYQIEGV